MFDGIKLFVMKRNMNEGKKLFATNCFLFKIEGRKRSRRDVIATKIDKEEKVTKPERKRIHVRRENSKKSLLGNTCLQLKIDGKCNAICTNTVITTMILRVCYEVYKSK